MKSEIENESLFGDIFNNDEERKNINWRVLSACGCLLGGFLCVVVPFVVPAFRKHCVPYVPATEKQIQLVLKTRKNVKGLLVDIGSGDGRVVIAAAKQGSMAHGIELNQWLVLYSRYQAWKQGVSHLTKFYCKDLWKSDLSGYQTLVLFGTSGMMTDFEKKLEREISEDCEVIATRFPLTTWIPHKKLIDSSSLGVNNVFVYSKQYKHKTI